MQLTIESNSAAIAQALRKAAQDIADTQPMMAAIGQRLETNIKHRFDTKSDPSGRAWEPYKAVSAVIHQAIYGKPPQGSLLERTGNLRRGVEHHASADQVEVGLTGPYAQHHELGTSGRVSKSGKPYGAIPRRGMVFGAVSGVGAAAQVTQALSAEDESDVLDIIQRHILQATSGLR